MRLAGRIAGHGPAGRIGRLLVLALLTAVVGGCGVVWPSSLVPSRGDSLRARRALDATLNDLARLGSAEWASLAGASASPLSRLPDGSLDAIKHRSQLSRAALRALDSIDVEALREDTYTTWQAVRWELESAAREAAYFWTDFSDVSPRRSTLAGAAVMLDRHRLTSDGDVENYLRLLSSVGDLADSVRSRLEARAARGATLPLDGLPRAEAFVRSLSRPYALSSFAPRSTRLARLSAEARERVANEAQPIVEARINPRLDALARYLGAEYRTRASTRPGLGQFPGGLEYYRFLLRRWSTTDITPEDAHALGLSEVARLDGLLRAAIRAAKVNPDPTTVRRWLRGGEAALDADSLERMVRRIVEATPTAASPAFGAVSAGRLTFARDSGLPAPIVPGEAYRATWPGEASATYRLDPAEWQSMGLASTSGRVWAELVPGRHALLSLQRENPRLPTVRRLWGEAAYEDGWSAYAMQVMDSLRVPTDVEAHAGALLLQMANACGLVVDTGINYYGWSKADALAFLRAHLPHEDDYLTRRYVEPAITDPASLTAAAIGARELNGLARWARRELDSDFDLQRFHGELLELGPVPLPVAGTHVEWWIWAERSRLSRSAGARNGR